MDIIKSNVLVDEAGRACLADFGLLGIISDGANHASSSSLPHGGTLRWMSPELFCPEDFGLEDSRRTERSDCYALGMVVYEVLSRQMPFHSCGDLAVVVKVSGGERPKRPQGVEGEWFTDGLWRILEHCWAHNPDDRPRVEDVLQCLEDVPRFWTSLSRAVANPPTMDSLVRNSSEPDAEGNTEESETPSPSQSSQTLPPTGDTDDKILMSTLPDLFLVPHYEVKNNLGSGAYVKNLGQLVLVDSVAVLERVGWTWLFDDFLD
jgi:serine/threonine protein kinase